MDIQTLPKSTNGHVSSNISRGSLSGRSRAQGRGDRGASMSQRRNRADFSQAGPNHDRSITTVVVEQIPEENFDEKSVRDFFSDFGNIEEVTMQAYKRLALVKYEDYYSAKRAYESPKVIFDNRFVKVYWYNPNTMPTAPTTGAGTKASSSTSPMKAEDSTFDKEKFERDSLAAQKKLEERKALQRETEARRLEIQKQKDELDRKRDEEKRKLEEKLKAKGLSLEDIGVEPSTNKPTQNGAPGSKASSQTEALRAQLAALEAEARGMGIDPDNPEPFPARGRGRGRGRGSYRGWEGFAGRGAGYDPSRGAYRGRGSFRGARGGGAYNLDNRTKKVKVEGVTFDEERDEGLKHFLIVSLTTWWSRAHTDDLKGHRRIREHRNECLERFSSHHVQRPLHGREANVWPERHTRGRKGRVQLVEHTFAARDTSGSEAGWRSGNGWAGYGPGEWGRRSRWASRGARGRLRCCGGGRSVGDGFVNGEEHL